MKIQLKLIDTTKIYKIEEKELKQLLGISNKEEIISLEFYKYENKWTVKTKFPIKVKMDFTDSTTTSSNTDI